MIGDIDSEFKRNKVLIRQFVFKSTIKVLAIAAIAFLAYLITETPILTNQVAMGQLENSNEWFVTMSMYQKFANVFGRVSSIGIAFIIGWIGHDIHSLAKSLKT